MSYLSGALVLGRDGVKGGRERGREGVDMNCVDMLPDCPKERKAYEERKKEKERDMNR